MIEPTETESKETLDAFCDAMIQIAREAETDPHAIHEAPVTTPVRRLDQTKAAREPNLRWRPRVERAARHRLDVLSAAWACAARRSPSAAWSSRGSSGARPRATPRAERSWDRGRGRRRRRRPRADPRPADRGRHARASPRASLGGLRGDQPMRARRWRACWRRWCSWPARCRRVARRRPAAVAPVLLGGTVALLVAAGVDESRGGAARAAGPSCWCSRPCTRWPPRSGSGGLVHLLVSVVHPRVAPAAAAALLRRFSTLALVRGRRARSRPGPASRSCTSDGPGGLIGTAYGLMVLTKIVLLGGLLALAAVKPRRRPAPGRRRPAAAAARGVWWRSSSASALTVLFAAASLTSLPPAVDVVGPTAPPRPRSSTRFTPRWPTPRRSPPIEAIAGRSGRAADRRRPRVVRVQPPRHRPVRARDGRPRPSSRWPVRAAARHWPLLFLGLAACHPRQERPRGLAARSEGFWAGMADPDVFAASDVRRSCRVRRLRVDRAHGSAPRAGGRADLPAAVRGRRRAPARARAREPESEGGVPRRGRRTRRSVSSACSSAGAAGSRSACRRRPRRLPGRLSASAMAAIGLLLLLYLQR